MSTNDPAAPNSSDLSAHGSDTVKLKTTKGGSRPKKDPLQPEKPKTAYHFFAEATRSELSSQLPGVRACRVLGSAQSARMQLPNCIAPLVDGPDVRARLDPPSHWQDAPDVRPQASSLSHSSSVRSGAS